MNIDDLMTILLFGIGGGIAAWLLGYFYKRITGKVLGGGEEGEPVKKATTRKVIVIALLLILVGIPIWHRTSCDQECRQMIYNWLH